MLCPEKRGRASPQRAPALSPQTPPRVGKHKAINTHSQELIKCKTISKQSFEFSVPCLFERMRVFIYPDTLLKTEQKPCFLKQKEILICQPLRFTPVGNVFSQKPCGSLHSSVCEAAVMTGPSEAAAWRPGPAPSCASPPPGLPAHPLPEEPKLVADSQLEKEVSAGPTDLNLPRGPAVSQISQVLGSRYQQQSPTCDSQVREKNQCTGCR